MVAAYEMIVERAVEFWSSQPIPPICKSKQPRLISWEPSLPDWKLNTDGSAISNSRLAGCGLVEVCFVFLRVNIWVIVFVRNVGNTTALVAELWAIYGLHIAIN
ncbi:hypothetical protein SLA2020_045730 [Shorea laevis]